MLRNGYSRLACLVLLLVSLACSVSPGGTATVVPVPVIGPPPAGHMYQGVYPGGSSGEEDDFTLADLRAYEALAGKPAAWVYFSHNWYRDRAFPLETAAWIRAVGSVPYIRLMLRSDSAQNHAEPVFTHDRILAGEFDGDLHAWFATARDFGTPLLVEWGTEMNGEWFPWNGVWYGGETGGYGEPAAPDGPERFRDAYRHIIQISREEQARNVRWVFHANHHDWPEDDWNRFENYYPGDDWINWIAVSVYGALTPLEEDWPAFSPALDAVYPRLVALAGEKPIILAEFGAAGGHPAGDQAEWARAALTDLTTGRWPRLAGFSWWNEHWQNDHNRAHDTSMRLQDNPDLAAVFQELVGENALVDGQAAITYDR